MALPAFAIEQARHAALRFAGGDAEQRIVATRQRRHHAGDPGIQRIVQRGLLTLAGKVGAVIFGELRLDAQGMLRRQHRERLRQRQPDHAQDIRAARRRQRQRRERVFHRRADRVLAVDQRAVAIENDELHGQAYSRKRRPRCRGGERPRGGYDGCQNKNAKEHAMTAKTWDFVHNLASDAKWTPGLREIFEYRDLGIKDGTHGDFVAHLIRHNGKKTKDEVQQWHVHDCTFQFVYVMNGWATFEYEGQGQRTIRKGDTILQVPGIKHREIACSEDFEVLEIVSPANFATRIVEGPQTKAQAAE